MFDAVRHKKAPQQIISQIRSAILEGRLRPGDKLPSEADLTAHFGVSRQTLREALRALEYLGLLDIRAGAAGGAFISEVDMETTRENLANFLHFKNISIQHLSEIRKILEPYAARIAADRMTPEELEKLRIIQESSVKALAEGDQPEFMRTGIRFHRTVANATHNPILILILDFIENMLEDVKKILNPDGDFSSHVLESHRLIYEALAAHDPERAAQEMLKDVSLVEASLIRLAEGRARIGLVNGTP